MDLAGASLENTEGLKYPINRINPLLEFRINFNTDRGGVKGYANSLLNAVKKTITADTLRTSNLYGYFRKKGLLVNYALNKDNSVVVSSIIVSDTSEFWSEPFSNDVFKLLLFQKIEFIFVKDYSRLRMLSGGYLRFTALTRGNGVGYNNYFQPPFPDTKGQSESSIFLSFGPGGQLIRLTGDYKTNEISWDKNSGSLLYANQLFDLDMALENQYWDGRPECPFLLIWNLKIHFWGGTQGGLYFREVENRPNNGTSYSNVYKLTNENFDFLRTKSRN